MGKGESLLKLVLGGLYEFRVYFEIEGGEAEKGPPGQQNSRTEGKDNRTRQDSSRTAQDAPGRCG